MTVDMSGGNDNMDYGQHKKSYDLFIVLVKYGTVIVLIVLALMWFFLL